MGRRPSRLSFLDFGMGWAEWALMARAFGCDAYGVEISEERIRHAEANGIKTFRPGGLPPGSFDIINANQVFEHVPDPLDTLRTLREALREGGVIKIAVPKTRDIYRRLKNGDWLADQHERRSLRAVAPLEHINFYRRETIRTMARKVGMEEVFVPMRLQYRFATNWNGVRGLVANLLGPIWMNVVKRYHWFLLQPVSR
ncbi:MAG: class I SAM-dependent methyltransferase [Kiritimatiellae bacterium]|nr:class I SAM-dependent methyltransferase [Kiritimatiellia bacterium]